VASGELSLVRLRERIEGRPRPDREAAAVAGGTAAEVPEEATDEPAAPEGPAAPVVLRDDSLLSAKASLSSALDELAGVLGSAEAMSQIGPVDRSNLAKYLTIAKLRLENVIAGIRASENR